MSLKTCNFCGNEKPLEAFRKNVTSPDGRRGTCTDCLKLKTAIRRGVATGKKICIHCKEDKELTAFHKHDETKDGYSTICKSCFQVGNRNKRRLELGWTEEQYAQKFVQQDGKCAICKIGDVPLAADHCHASLDRRGLLCTNCNLGLGNFRDDPEILQAAIEYLTAYRRAVGDYLEPEAQAQLLDVVRAHI